MKKPAQPSGSRPGPVSDARAEQLRLRPDEIVDKGMLAAAKEALAE
jgi:hypothetical protein